MKRLVSCVLLIAFGLCGVGAAGTVTLTDTVYERPGEAAEEAGFLVVHFIDVGGGDGILIETPSHKKILIDGGWSYADRKLGPAEYSTYLDEFLADDVVDLMIVSHPDYDHFSGLSDVLDRYVVRQLWYTGYDSEDLSRSWRDFLDKVGEEEGLLFLSPILDYLGLGSVIRFDDSDTHSAADDVVLTLINGQQWIGNVAYGSSRKLSKEGQRRNSSSLVLRMDYGETSFLFTGDTNGRNKDSDDLDACDDQELFMVRNNKNPENPLHGRLDCTVLKVAHHGSNGSASLPFLEAVKPAWAVISAGVHYGHPHASALERLKHANVGLDDSHILCTDEDEDGDHKASEANLGDDCYRFLVDLKGIVKIEKWNSFAGAE